MFIINGNPFTLGVPAPCPRSCLRLVFVVLHKNSDSSIMKLLPIIPLLSQPKSWIFAWFQTLKRPLMHTHAYSYKLFVHTGEAINHWLPLYKNIDGGRLSTEILCPLHQERA